MKHLTVKLDDKIHREFKISAINRKMTMQELTVHLINTYLAGQGVDVENGKKAGTGSSSGLAVI
jgi:hypothetical protein